MKQTANAIAAGISGVMPSAGWAAQSRNCCLIRVGNQRIIFGAAIVLLCASACVDSAAAKSSSSIKTGSKSANKTEGQTANKTASKTERKTVGWVIDQTSEEAGRGEIIVTKDGVRIKLKTLTAVITAPKFDATIFDTSTKKYVDLPYVKWTSKYKDKRPISITPTGKTAKIAGLNSTCYRVPSQKVTKEVWFTNDVPVSEDMCAFISTTMHLPSGHGLPVRLEVSRSVGKRVVFDTLKLRKTQISPKTFLVPEGFKKVESEYQVFVKESQVQDMGGFFQ